MATGDVGRRRARPRAMAESCQPTTSSQRERRSSSRRLAVYGPRTEASCCPSRTASPFGTGSVPGGARRARIDLSCSGPSRSLAATARRRGESWSRASPSRAAAPTRLVARTPNNATSTAAGSPIRCRPLLPRTSTAASTASRPDSAPPWSRAVRKVRIRTPAAATRGPPRATRRCASTAGAVDLGTAGGRPPDHHRRTWRPARSREPLRRGSATSHTRWSPSSTMPPLQRMRAIRP